METIFMKERDEKIKLEQKIEKDRPKVEIGEAMMYEDGSIDLFNMHKVLQKNGINLGRNNFYLWCRKNNLLNKSKNYNLPTKNAIEEGILIDETSPVIKNGIFITIKHKVKVSKLGQNIIVNNLIK